MAEALGNNGHHFLLVVVGEAVGHVFEDSVQSSHGRWAQVEDDEHFALCEIVGLELSQQGADGLRGISDWVLTQWERRRLQILQELRQRQVSKSRPNRTY
jgi:hypothetical protein